MLAHLGAAVLACVGLSSCVFYLNPLCNDQVRNGDETGIDCGGTCGKCNIGDSCRVDSDCDESTCERGICTALPCYNGKQDGQETDVDCGGGTCVARCSGGRHCDPKNDLLRSDCASGVCVVGSNTCFELDIATNMMPFADAVHYPSGDKTYAMFSGDLDGDGHVDLVAANEQGSSVSVFRNDGTGTGNFESLASGATAYPTGFYPTGGAIADFNNDGILDVITADYHGDSVSVLLGTASVVDPRKGTGVLAPKISYATIAGAETSNLAFGDLNGDGFLDVIAVNPSTRPESPPPSVSELLGRGDGSFGTAITTTVPVVGSKPYSVAIGDFDRNGTNDVAIADLANGPILVQLGNGDGTFQPVVQYGSGGAGATIIITYDVNLDGNLDLICANRNGDNVGVLLGRGDGTFRKAIVAPTGPGTNPYSVVVADFNLDCVPDLVTANFMTGNASILLGIGDGHFEKPIDAGPTALAKGKISYGVAAGDFNGDGKPDFAATNPGDNDISVKLNRSGPEPPPNLMKCPTSH